MIKRDSTLKRIAVVDGPGRVEIEPNGFLDRPCGLYEGSPPKAKVSFPTAPYFGTGWTAEQLAEWSEVFGEAAEAQAILEADKKTGDRRDDKTGG